MDPALSSLRAAQTPPTPGATRGEADVLSEQAQPGLESFST